MPATLTAPHVVASPARPLSAPLSRSGDAGVVFVPSPCMGCGSEVPEWGYRNVDGIGVLTHETAEDCEPCANARAFAFDFATGESV